VNTSDLKFLGIKPQGFGFMYNHFPKVTNGKWQLFVSLLHTGLWVRFHMFPSYSMACS